MALTCTQNHLFSWADSYEGAGCLVRNMILKFHKKIAALF